jgi:hypothetical protein
MHFAFDGLVDSRASRFVRSCSLRSCTRGVGSCLDQMAALDESLLCVVLLKKYQYKYESHELNTSTGTFLCG